MTYKIAIAMFLWKQGINRERVEQMEFRLKEDILVEASRYAAYSKKLVDNVDLNSTGNFYKLLVI